jgi:molybdopterin biosynthesis enzyme
MARAEAIAIIPEDVATLNAGAAVQVQLTELPEDH